MNASQMDFDGNYSAKKVAPIWLQSVLPSILMTALMFTANAATASKINFACVWDGQDEIGIVVDTVELTASRNDSGAGYTLLNVTEKAVFLQVIKSHWNRVAVQVIERPSGGWHDIVINDDGSQSALEGGVCVEQN